MQRVTVVSDTTGMHSNEIDIDTHNANLQLHCFVLNDEEPALEELEPTHDGDDFTLFQPVL